MSPIDYTKIFDHIRHSTDYWVAKKELHLIKPPQREQVIALKFKKGQKVIDKITGEEVTIIGGTRTVVAFRSTGSKRS